MYVTEAQALQSMCCQNTTYKCVCTHCLGWRWCLPPTDPQPPGALGYCGLGFKPDYSPPKNGTGSGATEGVSDAVPAPSL